MQKLPARVPRGDANRLNILPNGVLGFVAGAILDVMDGATGGIFNLDELGDRFRGTEKAAEQAQETAAAASNLAVLYNFDIAANREKYPAAAPFSFTTASYAFSGNTVALVSPAGGYTGYDTQRLGPDFKVTPEEKIYLEWRQRRSAANFTARASLTVLDANGQPIATDLAPVQPLVNVADNTWVKYSGIVDIPVGANTATPELRLQLAAGQAPTGLWAFDNVVIRRASGADLSDIQAQLAGKADYSDIPTNVPLWQSILSTDDPVFPGFANVFHTTGNSDGGNYRETRDPTFSTTSGEMDVGYIRTLRDREYTQVGFMTAQSGLIGGGPFEAHLCVYKLNQSTGEITRVWWSGDVKSTVASVGSGRVVRLAMPALSASQGDVWGVGLVQRANTTNPSYSIYGIKGPYIGYPSGVWPRSLYSRADVGTTFPPPISISGSSMAWNDENTPWFFLG